MPRSLLLGGLCHHLGPLGLPLCTGPLVDRLLNNNFLPLSLLTTHLGGVSTSDARQGLQSVSGEMRHGGGAGCMKQAAQCMNGAGGVEWRRGAATWSGE